MIVQFYSDSNYDGFSRIIERRPAFRDARFDPVHRIVEIDFMEDQFQRVAEDWGGVIVEYE